MGTYFINNLLNRNRNKRQKIYSVFCISASLALSFLLTDLLTDEQVKTTRVKTIRAAADPIKPRMRMSVIMLFIYFIQLLYLVIQGQDDQGGCCGYLVKIFQIIYLDYNLFNTFNFILISFIWGQYDQGCFRTN